MWQVAAFLNVTCTEDFYIMRILWAQELFIVYRQKGWASEQIKRAVNREAYGLWQLHVKFKRVIVDEHASGE
jgi:hypothetical protein